MEQNGVEGKGVIGRSGAEWSRRRGVIGRTWKEWSMEEMSHRKDIEGKESLEPAGSFSLR